jgi:hypothetical protein
LQASPSPASLLTAEGQSISIPSSGKMTAYFILSSMPPKTGFVRKSIQPEDVPSGNPIFGDQTIHE